MSRNLRFRVGLIVVSLFLGACGSGGSSSTGNAGAQSFSLSGTIFIEPESNVDTDVERRFNTSLENNNNDFANAQRLTNPTMLGGYISGTSGQYYEDESGDLGEFPVSFEKDLNDIYSVDLLANQQLVLSVFRANDLGTTAGNAIALQFKVYNAVDTETPGTLVADVSFSEPLTQSINVSADGSYFIEVEAQDNLSTPLLYALSVGQSNAGAAAVDPMLNAPFVPGEVLVKFKEQASVATQNLDEGPLIRRAGARSVAEGMQRIQKVGGIATHYRLSDNTMAAQLQFEAQGAGTLSVQQQQKWQTLQLIASLRQRDDVEFAEPNYLLRASAIPNDTAYNQQWNLPMLELPAAWDRSTGLNSIVAVIDTGIDANHNDLAGNISSEGYDFIVSTSLSGDGDGPDNNPHDEGDTYHGAHVAGIVAAQGNNGRGIAGVAYDATIMPLRALGVDGTGTLADISNAILYAAGLDSTAPSTPSRAADIINLSLGVSETDLRLPNGQLGGQTMQNAIQQAVNAGVIVVAAAGNSNSSVPNYPAAYDGVIAVSSVNDRRSKSNFSNYGSYIDVAAPGGTSFGSPYFDGFQDGILSTIYANEYTELVGTSMATPHVAGVAALMKSIDPSLDGDRFRASLAAGDLTDDLGNSTFYGNGLINAAKALASLGQTLSAQLNVFPRQLNFNGANTSGIIYMSNPGQGTVEVTSVSSQAGWLEITPKPGLVNAQGLGEYAANVDVTSAPETGSTQIIIGHEIDGIAQDDIVLTAFITQSSADDDTVGQLYVYLLRKEDVEAAEPEAAISVFASVNAVKGLGEYTYTFTNLPPGQYFLEASTDNDGDFFVFDDGEAKGAYPLLYENQLVNVVDGNLNGYDFDIGYLRFISGADASSAEQDNTTRKSFKRRLNR